MIKYTTGFVDKLEDILSESGYRVRYERGNFQSGWCLLDHKSVVVLNKFLNIEGRVNTLVDLIPQLKIDFDKLTLASQKIYDFLTANHLKKSSIETPPDRPEDRLEEDPTSVVNTESPQDEGDTVTESGQTPEENSSDESPDPSGENRKEESV